MRVLIVIVGALLVALMLSEFFVTFMLPRVGRDPLIAHGLDWLLWRRWRALARRLEPAGADTLLGFFGPLALLAQLVVWALGLMTGYGLIEWAVAGGSFSTRFLASSGLFLSAGASSGSVGVHVVELLEAATGVGVLFISIGYMPAVYSAFSRRETAVSQLATRAGSPPAAAALLQRAAARGSWRHLEHDLQAWEKWAAELMETHLTYPLLAFYRSQHANQNWLGALTAIVDVTAFIKAAAPDENGDAADITFRIGRHALADLALQLRLEPVPVERLSDSDFDDLFAIIDRSELANVDREVARGRLDQYRSEYEANAQALADSLALALPPWFCRKDSGRQARELPTCGADAARDLVGLPTSHEARRGRRRARIRLHSTADGR